MATEWGNASSEVLELKVPLACDDSQNLVAPEYAEKCKRYFCPSCGDLLVFRHGVIRAPHFAHKRSATCSQETITHKTAKLLIQKAVGDWKAGKAEAPVLVRRCRFCECEVRQPIPDKVETAVSEYRLPSGLVLDIALLSGGKPEAAIEIRVTHGVPDVKAAQLPIPFVELGGNQVLLNPREWKPITDAFKPPTCVACRDAPARFSERTREISRQTGVLLPDSYYRYAPGKCFRCSKDILVFTWPGHALDSPRPPVKQPKPMTLRYECSKTISGKYWANTCPYCKVIQGDWFLYEEPEGPFFRFKCGPDTPGAFCTDLVALARLAREKEVGGFVAW